MLTRTPRSRSGLWARVSRHAMPSIAGLGLVILLLNTVTRVGACGSRTARPPSAYHVTGLSTGCVIWEAINATWPPGRRSRSVLCPSSWKGLRSESLDCAQLLSANRAGEASGRPARCSAAIRARPLPDRSTDPPQIVVGVAQQPAEFSVCAVTLPSQPLGVISGDGPGHAHRATQHHGHEYPQ